MKKYVKIMWICLLVIALQMSSFSNVFVTYAEDIGNDVTSIVATQFIQGVDIKDKTGSTIGDTLIGQANIEKTTDFWLMYEFELENKYQIDPNIPLDPNDPNDPNSYTIASGDYIILNVPAAIDLSSAFINTSTPITSLMIDAVTKIADAYLIDGNKIKLVFTNEVEQLSDVGGAFFIAGGFNQDEINLDGSDTEIDFDIPLKSLTLSFKADPIALPDPVTVQKEGSLSGGTNIKWSITINKENVVVNNATLVDSLPASQVLDIQSIKVNNGAPTSGVSYDNNTLRLSLGDITTQQVVTFETKLTEEALLNALAEGKTTIKVINDATLEHDDAQITDADQPKEVNIPLNILNKSGQYIGTTTAENTKNIIWTIEVNKDKLSFNNAKIQDKLPQGLTFVPGSAKINGNATVPSTLNGSDLTFNLGNITDTVTITYETAINPSYFLVNGNYTFKNKAVFTWDGLTGTGVVKEGSVGVNSSLISKSGTHYNRSNGVITWTIQVNNNRITLDAPTITDSIPADQQYIEGSAKILNAQGAVFTDGNFQFDAATNVLRYNFNASEISSSYTITFDTKPVSTELITANHSGKFLNSANLNNGTINLNVNAEMPYTSNVFQKDQAGYDVENRVITWKFTVNENGATTPSSNAQAVDPSLYNAIPLTNVVIYDDIPEGLEFIPNEIQMLDRSGNDVTSMITVEEHDGISIKFNGSITESYAIYMKTKIVDESKFTKQNNQLHNGNFNVSNEATLTHNESTKLNKDIATQEIQNNIISKKALPTQHGNKYIDWVVYLNSNAVNLNALLDVDQFWLVDQLEEGLELDTTSVSFIAYDRAIVLPSQIPASGDDGLGAGRMIPLDGTHVKYDATSREFRFNFPGDQITTAYKLSFRTYVTESVSSGTQFSNGIHLFGTKDGNPVSIEDAYHSEDTRQVSFIEAGSLGYGSLGKIVVNKVDLEDTSKKLSGATFALYDRFGNIVQQKNTVDGQLEFNRIKSDLSYYVKELAAPEGYLLSGDVRLDNQLVSFTTTDDVIADAIEVKLNSVQNQKLLEITFSNQKIKTTVQFNKVNEDGQALAGAVFELLDESDAIIQTETSLQEGLVSFENVSKGTYTIREKTAPIGYNPLTDEFKVTVVEENHAVPIVLSDVTNEIIQGNISVTKVSSKDGNPLKGAVFALYSTTDTNFKTPIAQTTSDENGIALFTDIDYGDYVVKETKAPSGYQKSSDVLNVSVQEEGKTYDLGTFTNDKVNVDIPVEFSKVNVIKTNIMGEKLSGAKFALYNENGDLVAEETTSASGKAQFTVLATGEYTLKEVVAPEMYVLSDKVLEINIDELGKVAEYTVVNERSSEFPWASVSVKKTDEDGITPLAGAVFGLYEASDLSFNNPVLVGTSDETGSVLFTNIAEGQYVVKEISAPEGYVLSNEVLKVTVGKLRETYDAGKLVNVKDQEIIDIPEDETDGPNVPETDIPESNSEVGVNTPTESNDSSSENSSWLSNPTGEIKTDQIQSENKPQTNQPTQSNELPITGDNIHWMVWLFGVSGLILAALLLVGKRKSNKVEF